MKTPEGYSTMLMPPVLKDVLPITALSAIVDTDKFISDGHMSFYVKKGFKGLIKQGTPLIQAIPFKREDWEHECLPYSKKLIEPQRRIIRSTFVNGYKLKFWSRKNFH